MKRPKRLLCTESLQPAPGDVFVFPSHGVYGGGISSFLYNDKNDVKIRRWEYDEVCFIINSALNDEVGVFIVKAFFARDSAVFVFYYDCQ
jgi:hypothetical protein